MIEPVQGPFPAAELWQYLAKRAIPVVEAVEALVYRRKGPDSEVIVSFDSHLRLEALGRAPTEHERHRVSAVFQHTIDWTPPKLFIIDPVLGPLVTRTPGFRPLGCWEPFELCLRTIVGQQVSVAAAGTLMRRLGERAGGWSPEQVARANLDAMGMPGKRVLTLRSLAEKAASGDIPWSAPWPDLREALSALPGFGPWTLDYLGIRLGRDLDSFPAADLGLMRGVNVRSPKELIARAERWRPYRGWAASYLWMG